MADATNLPASFTDAMNTAKLCGGNWRKGRENAKKLAKALILTAVNHDFAVKALFKDCRKAMGGVPAEDKNNVDRFFSDVKTIIENWSDIPQTVKDAYLSGVAPTYATVIADIKAREKAEKKAEDEANTAALLEEAGVTLEEYTANQARLADAALNVAAIARVTAMLGNTERTDDETTALSGLLDAVNAYQAFVTENAQAA